MAMKPAIYGWSDDHPISIATAFRGNSQPCLTTGRKDPGGFFGCLRWPDYGGFYDFLLISIQTFYWWIYDDIYYIILCYIILCYIMLCYIILCYVMLCYVILYYIIWYCMVLYGHVIYKYICIIFFYGLWVFFSKMTTSFVLPSVSIFVA